MSAIVNLNTMDFRNGLDILKRIHAEAKHTLLVLSRKSFFFQIPLQTMMINDETVLGLYAVHVLKLIYLLKWCFVSTFCINISFLKNWFVILKISVVSFVFLCHLFSRNGLGRWFMVLTKWQRRK